MRTLLTVALIASVAVAGGKADRLGAKAKAEMDAAEAGWNQYLRDSDKLTDGDIRKVAAHYDKAISLMHAITEEGESASASNGILLLGRRTAKLRAVLFHREMRRKAEAFEAAKKARKADPKKPGPEADEPNPHKPDPLVDRGTANPKPPSGWSGTAAPQIQETKKERAASLRAIRRFAYEYFRHMKPGNIRESCPRCNGKGSVLKVGSRGRAVRKPCKSCRQQGYYFDKDHARRGLWLTRTPIARTDDKVRAEYEQFVKSGTESPRAVEPITRLVIKDVEYHGLTAIVEWEETRGKGNVKTVRTALVRLGGNWFFRTPGADDHLFRSDEEKEGK